MQFSGSLTLVKEESGHIRNVEKAFSANRILHGIPD